MRTKKVHINIITILFTIILFSHSIYASENNFLNVEIKEDKEGLVIQEQWNIVGKENNLFEREIPLDKNSISNISIKQIFPTSKSLLYMENYNQSNNITTINSTSNSKNGETSVLILEYKLSLDKKTKSNLIEHLPYSIFTSNPHKIKKINLKLHTENHKYSGIVNFGTNDEFAQTTSKTKTIEVFIQLFKLLIYLFIIGATCLVGYTIALVLYYRNKNNIKQKNQLKKIKSNKKIKHLRTRIR